MTASPLRVEDALSYLDNVKNQFSDQPRNRDQNHDSKVLMRLKMIGDQRTLLIGEFQSAILYLFEMRLTL